MDTYDLICPGCGCSNVHFSSVHVNQNGHVSFANGTTAVTHNHGSRTGRGSRVTISYRCENGCRFAISQQFHKGTISTTTKVFYVGRADMRFRGLWRD